MLVVQKIKWVLYKKTCVPPPDENDCGSDVAPPENVVQQLE